MAAGFVLVWLTGVLTINLEGLGTEEWDARQGAVRDFHKSLALTLAALAVVRLFARWLLPIPRLPTTIPALERRLAHAGHAALYSLIFLTSVAGLAIADLQAFGNKYWGVSLPQLFPTTEVVMGWRVDPWAYVVHALLAYVLLALVCLHVAAVYVHRRAGIDLSDRIAGRGKSARFAVRASAMALAAVMVLVAAGAMRGHLTLAPSETPRDYRGSAGLTK
jgi:cytochrome b561